MAYPVFLMQYDSLLIQDFYSLIRDDLLLIFRNTYQALNLLRN